MTFVKVNNGPRVVNSLLDGFLNVLPAVFGKDIKSGFQFPPVNIAETRDGYHLELNVPGRSKEDFQLQVDNGLLTIGYEAREETKPEDFKSIRNEFSLQSFKRSFTLDETIDAEGIKASYENGLLKLWLPKKEQQKDAVKQISIQ
jgi:HSP20 family protein